MEAVRIIPEFAGITEHETHLSDAEVKVHGETLVITHEDEDA